jgi:hypothetical protein
MCASGPCPQRIKPEVTPLPTLHPEPRTGDQPHNVSDTGGSPYSLEVLNESSDTSERLEMPRGFRPRGFRVALGDLTAIGLGLVVCLALVTMLSVATVQYRDALRQLR